MSRCATSSSRHVSTIQRLALARARALGAELWGDLRQTDTYFNVPSGRLKLRETAGLQAELIAYERDEDAADRTSDYQIARTTTRPRCSTS